MLGYPPTPPPRGAWRLTARPADPQGLGQPRGGGAPPPPTAPKTGAHPSGSHIGWRRPPWKGVLLFVVPLCQGPLVVSLLVLKRYGNGGLEVALQASSSVHCSQNSILIWCFRTASLCCVARQPHGAHFLRTDPLSVSVDDYSFDL